jgi:heptosyltransferase-2
MDASPESLLVRAPNWLGDTVMALPALRALRAGFAGSRIIVVGRWAGLLAGQGVADALLPYPRGWRERARFNRALAEDGADIAVILPNSFESAWAASRWGARLRIGFDTDIRRPLLTHPVPPPTPRLHQADEYALLLQALDLEVKDRTPAWRLCDHPERAARVAELLEAAGLHGRARPVGLHLGAAFGSSKLWPPESLGRLAARLEAAGIRCLLLGTRDDAQAAAAVTAAAKRPLPSLVGADTPDLLPHLLSRLAVLVSGDTGVAHLAAAVGTPTVTLFGPTDPRLTAPRAERARIIYRGVPCSPCFLQACPIDHVCLRGIAAEEVEDHVRSLLAA